MLFSAWISYALYSDLRPFSLELLSFLNLFIRLTYQLYYAVWWRSVVVQTSMSVRCQQSSATGASTHTVVTTAPVVTATDHRAVPQKPCVSVRTA